MSYSEENGLVILSMSREEYAYLLIALEMARGRGRELACGTSGFDHFVDRLNEGNPNYTPYQVEAKK